MSQPDANPGNTRSTNRSLGFRRLCRLARKELVEILRDRRTIITLLLMPVLVYPLLGIIAQKFLIRSLVGQPAVVYRIGFENEQQRVAFLELVSVGDQLIKKNETAADDNDSDKSADGTDNDAEAANNQKQQESANGDNNDGASRLSQIVPTFDPDEPKITAHLPEDESTGIDLDNLIAIGELDLGVRVVHNDKDEATGFRILHNRQSPISQNALHYIGRRLRLANESWISEILAKRLKVTLRTPGAFVATSVESKQSKKPPLLTFIPLMLVLMTITGAVYPAIDLTAGERERGTMEILVSAPVSRMSLLTGKFVAVVAVAMLTAIVNLLAMLITVYTLGLEQTVFGEQGIPWSVVLAILFLLLVLASFFSATLLGLTSFARSFKEAQAYLIPLMLVAFAPGLLSLNPNLEMTPMLAIVPLANIVLVGRDLLTGSVNPTLFAISIISTILYGLLALSVAARVFGADSVLTGGSTSWADLFRRSAARQPQPSVPTAMFFLAFLFPCFIIISGLASRVEGTIASRLIYNAVITFALFVLLPLLFTILFNLRRRSTFFLYLPSFVAIVAAACLGISVWVVAYEVEIFSLSGARLEKLTEMFSGMKLELQKLPLGLKLGCLAVTPAVCEEFTFRGFLLSAFRKRSSALVSVVVTAVLFGLFHVFVRDALLFERMLPSTLMGLLLGFVCVRTGSLIPGILLHVLHNGLLITMAHYEQQIAEWGIGLSDQQHLPIEWIGYAAIGILIGMLLLLFTNPRRDSTKPADAEKL